MAARKIAHLTCKVFKQTIKNARNASKEKGQTSVDRFYCWLNGSYSLSVVVHVIVLNSNDMFWHLVA